MAEAKTLESNPKAAEVNDVARAFERLRSSLRGYFRRQSVDPTSADDLLQDVFVKALTAVRSHRAPTNLSAWLYAAARTTVVDHFRSRRRIITTTIDNLPDTETVEDQRLHQELATCLEPFIRQLPAIYRDSLLAAEIANRTMRSIADEQCISLSAAKSRVSRGRVMLRSLIENCCHVEISDGTVSDFYKRERPESNRNGCCS